MSILLVVGTRPEIIKMSPIVEMLRRLGIRYTVAFTAQHFTPSLGTDILKEFGYDNKNVVQLAATGLWRQLHNLAHEAEAVFVQGDTTSAALGAVAAVANKAVLFHVEAGLRSYDSRMREERNRILIDHAADMLFAPCEIHAAHLRNEEVRGRIRVVGNTIADVLAAWKKDRSPPFKMSTVLITLHRPELISRPVLFQQVLDFIASVLEKSELRGLYPAHPFSYGKIREGIRVPSVIDVVEPVRAKKCWRLIEESPFVFTDSGGIQEEAAILGTPCFTVRPNTERPETLQIGANLLLRPDGVEEMRAGFQEHSVREWKHPYGECVAEKIVDVALQALAKMKYRDE